MKSILTHLVILIVAIVSVWLTATFQQVTVQNKEDLRAISCGWPLTFVTSNQEWRDPPYPYTLKCLSGEWGDSAVMQWSSVALNVLVFYVGLAALLQIIRIVRLKKK
ncbi:MAG: hypothetical protein RL097_656 [Candidatus Parcubacteria bacterium]|jgi:uncharacterized membrane protein YuzA (DUF378 family)